MACVVIFLGVAGVMLLSRVQSAMAQQESGVGATEPEWIDRAAQEEAGSPLLAGRFDGVIPDLLKQAAANPDDAAIQFHWALFISEPSVLPKDSPRPTRLRTRLSESSPSLDAPGPDADGGA